MPSVFPQYASRTSHYYPVSFSVFHKEPRYWSMPAKQFKGPLHITFDRRSQMARLLSSVIRVQPACSDDSCVPEHQSHWNQRDLVAIESMDPVLLDGSVDHVTCSRSLQSSTINRNRLLLQRYCVREVIGVLLYRPFYPLFAFPISLNPTN